VAALEHETAEAAVGRYSTEAPPSALQGQREWIDACYSADDAGDIVRRLRGYEGVGSDEAAQAADAIEAKSPTSVKVTLAALRRAKGRTLDEALAQEYRTGLRFLEAPDFREGIRAQVVDKDRNPRWNPATLADVAPEQVERFFEPLGSRELDLRGVDPQLKEPDHD
jgi:enoyl-CoA hydratase